PSRLLDRRGRPPRCMAAIATHARLRHPGRRRCVAAPRRGRALALRPGVRARDLRARPRPPRGRRPMSGRMRRVNEAVKQVLSEVIPSLKDPRIGFVTVTTVETTTDLDHAKVWVSVFGGENQRKKTLEALDGAAGVLRTPRLEFVYDRAVEQGVRMTRLIDELAPPTETTMPSSDIDAVVEALR